MPTIWKIVLPPSWFTVLRTWEPRGDLVNQTAAANKEGTTNICIQAACNDVYLLT